MSAYNLEEEQRRGSVILRCQILSGREDIVKRDQTDCLDQKAGEGMLGRVVDTLGYP